MRNTQKFGFKIIQNLNISVLNSNYQTGDLKNNYQTFAFVLQQFYFYKIQYFK